jgi:diguanylate cyclase (GGDEF)-like protein
MSERPERAGLLVSACDKRRGEFQSACAELFGRLLLAEDAVEGARLLAQHPVDLLVVDLERFDAGLHLAALEQLLDARAGRRTLLLCPWDRAGWLAALLRFGGAGYAVGPFLAGELAEVVSAELAALAPGNVPPAPAAPAAAALHAMSAAPAAAALHAMLAAAAALQQAVSTSAERDGLGERACAAVALWPGVVHAALFQLEGDGHLRLSGQHGCCGLDLAGLLPPRDWLLRGNRRHTFPGLLAAASGEIALLDAPVKACEPELAHALRAHGVQMALGIPIPADGPAAPRGALCLLFGVQRQFDAVELAALSGLGQLAGLGLQVEALRRAHGEMQERVARVVTTDDLTGAASRRHGEALLEQELRRARRHALPLALVAFDIDGFRHVNEQYGLPVGDMVLRAVADAVRAQLRSHDMLVRSGGEEFQIIAPHTGAADGLSLAEKLRSALEREPIPGCDRITVSLGVAQLVGTESGGSLALRADAARSRAKRHGGNRVELAQH